ncbi:MAG: hypothetical protein GY851_09075 [bacterium]|nr:hypothetical protein [bacterium]
MALMHPALFTLLRLRVRGLFRRMGGSLRTPKGVIMTLVGLGMFGLWLAPSLVLAFKGEGQDPAQLRLFFPLGVLGLTAITLFTSLGDRAIFFNPAEVAFLFAGPFGRRELLAFKTLVSLVGTLFSSLIFTVIMVRFGAPIQSAYVGVFLSFMFVNLLTTAVLLIGQMIEERAYTRARKLLLLGLLIVVATAVGPAVSEGADRGFVEVLREARLSSPLRDLLIPFEPFARVVTAQRVFPDLLGWGAAALAIDFALFILVIYLDAEYRDTAVSVSQKMSRRLEQVKRSGMGHGTGATTAKRRIPPLPWLGGAGPIVWRQLNNAVRNSRSVLILAVFMAVGVIGPLAVRGGELEKLLPALVGGMIWLTIILTMTLRFDFRADVDQMDWIKMMPFPPAALMAGQIAVPILICTAFQALGFGFVAHVRQTPELLPLCVAFAVPVNIILFGTENVIFLLWPTRQAVFSPGDFQAFGRHLLMMMVKTLVALGCCAVAAGIGALGYYATGGSLVVGGIVGWIVLTSLSLVVIPSGAWAYKRFDISMDMPA